LKVFRDVWKKPNTNPHPPMGKGLIKIVQKKTLAPDPGRTFNRSYNQAKKSSPLGNKIFQKKGCGKQKMRRWPKDRKFKTWPPL
jgi:hypothetical protein